MKYGLVTLLCGLVALSQAYWVTAMENDDIPKNTSAALHFCYDDIEHYAAEHSGKLPSLLEGQALCKSFDPRLLYNPDVGDKQLATLPRSTWIVRTGPQGENDWFIGRAGTMTRERPNLSGWRFWNAGGFPACLSLIFAGLGAVKNQVEGRRTVPLG